MGAFDILKFWYKKFTGKAVKPAEIEIEETRKVYEKLFTKVEMDECLPFEF